VDRGAKKKPVTITTLDLRLLPSKSLATKIPKNQARFFNDIDTKMRKESAALTSNNFEGLLQTIRHGQQGTVNTIIEVRLSNGEQCKVPMYRTKES
jgi:hypothetical protein